jgi:nucleoid DNA-binding protein
MAKKAAMKAGGATSSATGKKPAIKAATKGEVFTKLSAKTGLTKKQVATVFDALHELISNELGKKGPGLFQIPGLIKMKVVRKEATKAKQAINPFTKQMQMYKAKPARNVVKAYALKSVKEMV